jgi:hypothetical protein
MYFATSASDAMSSLSSAGAFRKLTRVTRSDIRLSVSLLLLSTVLGVTNVNFIVLKASNLGLDRGKNPCSVQETSSFKAEADAEEHVHHGVGQNPRGNAEATNCHEMDPRIVVIRDPMKPQVQKCLESIRDSIDIVCLTGDNVQRGHAGHHKHTEHHTKLNPGRLRPLPLNKRSQVV